VSEKLVGSDFAARVQPADGAAEIDGVPEDDSGYREIEAGSAVVLVFESPVADFAEAMKEHSAREGVSRFTLVEARVGPPPQGGIAILSSVNSVRSKRPISLSALASAFCRG